MMDFLTVDLPATKTLLENEDVVVEIHFKAETSNSVKYTLVAKRKKNRNRVGPRVHKNEWSAAKSKKFSQDAIHSKK